MILHHLRAGEPLGASERHPLSAAPTSGLFLKLMLSTRSPGRLGSRGPDGGGCLVGGGNRSLLTVIAVVVHQNDFFYQAGWAFLKHAEERQKDKAAGLSGYDWGVQFSPLGPRGAAQSGALSAPPKTAPARLCWGSGPRSASLPGDVPCPHKRQRVATDGSRWPHLTTVLSKADLASL